MRQLNLLWNIFNRDLTNFVVKQLLILKIWICSVYIVVAVWQSGSKFNLYSATLLIRTLFRIRIWILSKLGANFWIRSRSKYRTSIMYVNPQHWSEISCFQRNILPGKVLSPTCWPVLFFWLIFPMRWMLRRILVLYHVFSARTPTQRWAHCWIFDKF